MNCVSTGCFSSLSLRRKTICEVRGSAMLFFTTDDHLIPCCTTSRKSIKKVCSFVFSPTRVFSHLLDRNVVESRLHQQFLQFFLSKVVRGVQNFPRLRISRKVGMLFAGDCFVLLVQSCVCFVDIPTDPGTGQVDAPPVRPTELPGVAQRGSALSGPADDRQE